MKSLKKQQVERNWFSLWHRLYRNCKSKRILVS